MMLPNKNSLNEITLQIKEENINDVIDYRVETVDFPDSPNHHSLLEVTHIKEEIEDTDEKRDGTLGRKKINVSQFVEENEFEASDEKFKIESDEYDAGIDSMSMDGSRKKIPIDPEILDNEDDQRSLSSLSSRSNLDVFSPSDDIVLEDEDDRPTLDELDEYSSLGSDHIPEMSAAEELEEERSWKTCCINGEEKKIDMKVIEPYRKVLSHGGYEDSSCNAIILFSACYLPDRSRKDYDYVMDNLFLYVVVTLDELIAENYVLIYLHGATESSSMPSFGWLKRCYQMIDRRLRKNLKKLYLVHPTFWLKTIVIMTRPFISAKFSQKLKFINSLRELSTFVPLKNANIPDKVKLLDFKNNFGEYIDGNHSFHGSLYNAYLKSLQTAS